MNTYPSVSNPPLSRLMRMWLAASCLCSLFSLFLFLVLCKSHSTFKAWCLYLLSLKTVILPFVCVLLFTIFCCICWKGERKRPVGRCCLSRDNGLLRSSSAAITALLISWLLLCPSAHLHVNRADLKITMVSCHLLDLGQNYMRLVVLCPWLIQNQSSLTKKSVESLCNDETHSM